MAQRTPACTPPSSGAYTLSPTCSELSTGEAEWSSNILQGRLTSSESWEGAVEVKDGISQSSRRNCAWRQMSSVSSQHMGRNYFPSGSCCHRPPRQPLVSSASSQRGSVNMPLALQTPAAAALAPCLNKPCRVSFGGEGERGCCLSKAAVRSAAVLAD